MVTARGILDDYLARGFESQPYHQLDQLFEADSSGPLDFVHTCLDHLPKSVTFAADAVSYVPSDQLPEVAAHAVKVISEVPLTGQSYAEEVIERLSLQAPELLAQHLPLLWRLRPNESSYTALWPWHAADAAEVARLRALSRGDDASRAVQALLETRDPHIVRALLNEDPDLPGMRLRVRDLVTSYGFDATGRSLVPPAIFHVIPEEPPRLHFAAGPLSKPHPTWRGSPDGSARVGGVSATPCAVCGSPLHLLFELDAVPSGLGVSEPTLKLATCLSCVGWSVRHLFMSHRNGEAEPVYAPPPAQPQFPSVGLKRQQVGLLVTEPRWRSQDWGVSNSRENLNRLGGSPTWVQSADYPTCPSCGNAMAALMQLDSFWPLADGGELYWGSGGVGYVTWCDDCSISAVGWQCP